MTTPDDPPRDASLHTGTSRFTATNAYFARALTAASAHCEIHTSDDIYDVRGMKLWARGKRVDPHLLELLANRTLRRPIETCVYARDPVATAAIADLVEQNAAASSDFSAAVAPRLALTLRTVRSIVPNPTELMLLSVLRHGERELLSHAARVTAIALTLGFSMSLEAGEMHMLGRAALLHDVGELYLPMPTVAVDIARALRAHPAIGAQVAVELAHAGPRVGQWIALSHERLDGSGYPRGVRAVDIPRPAQALLFAEAIADLLAVPENGARRATVSIRIGAAGFAPDMVNWLATLGRVRPAHQVDATAAQPIGEQMREIHELLGRAHVVLQLPVGESTEVVDAAAQWLETIAMLMWALRSSGVEDALINGHVLEPQSESEAVELTALQEQIMASCVDLRSRVDLFLADRPEAAGSRLVAEVLELLPMGDLPVVSEP